MSLDPNQNRLAALLAEQQVEQLEPDFPFTAISFDASFFGADQDPILPDGKTAYETP
jgi:hypothetical protein